MIFKKIIYSIKCVMKRKKNENRAILLLIVGDQSELHTNALQMNAYRRLLSQIEVRRGDPTQLN